MKREKRKDEKMKRYIKKYEKSEKNRWKDVKKRECEKMWKERVRKRVEEEEAIIKKYIST